MSIADCNGGWRVKVMKLQNTLILGLLLVGDIAAAQEQPNSAQYHAVHNPNSPHYVGSNQQPAAPQPTGYWQKTWGAIATSETGGVLGTAVGEADKAQAEQVAMRDCVTKGGGGCRVDLSYHNQCAAVVLGADFLRLYGAGSIEKASERGLQECNSEHGNCRVYYSACTEPIFHKY
jgi:hypothetical protein